MKKIIVLYHSNCPDGLGAAWVAWKKFGKRAEYIPIEPREVPKISYKNKEVYVLDNSFPKAAVKRLEKQVKKLVIIDHHISSKPDVLSATFHLFDNNHSGAVLSWKYFFPRVPVPKFLLHVEDFDLWRFKIHKTKEVMALFGFQDFEVHYFDGLMKQYSMSRTRKKLLERGHVLLVYQNRLVERFIKNAELIKMAGHSVLAVNSPVYNSEIAAALWKMKGPFGVVWYEKAGWRRFSLRSNAHGNFDVSKVAKKFNDGGGHKAAAGFALPVSKGFPWKVISK